MRVSSSLKDQWRCAASARFGGDESDEFRTRITDIDGMDARSCALQPKQHFPARCLQNRSGTHYLFHHFRYQILPSRFQLPDPGFQILATRFWLLAPGYQILAPRSWLLAPGYQILAPRSWLPDPGFQSWLPGPISRSWLLSRTRDSGPP